MHPKKGFTLIELSMVLVVSAILAGAVVPNFIRSVRIEAGRKTAMEISQIAEALRAYYVDQNKWPETFDDLSAKGFIDPAWIRKNPFGKPYVFQLNGVNLDIVTVLPLEIAPVTAGLLPMSAVSAEQVRSTVTLPGASAAGIPSGMIVPWGSSVIPAGWLICDGRAVSRLDEALLFGVIGTTYGAGDGVTTFNLPDLRGRTVVGLDDMGSGLANTITDTRARVLGGILGEEKHQLTVAEMPAHSHGYGQAYSGGRYDGHSSPLYNATQWVQSGAAGGDQPHNNLQPSMALYWIIKS
ncbi:MAG: tail fiber protein [Candidatus Omnitrophica bacterium]|nr:tail fiber protein [Candidatus Omnitrophota bacterium]